MKIGEVNIDRLSGPVSFSILEPHVYFYNELKKTNTNCPVIILLGDEHSNPYFHCENCLDTIEDKCLKSFNKPFLELIDNLNANIDFYIEGFTTDIQYIKEYKFPYNTEPKLLKKDYPINELREKIWDCYFKNRKNKCPTKNINWHFADARYTRYTEYIYNGIYFMEEFKYLQ